MKKNVLNKNIMKKLVVSVLTFSMIFGLSGSVFGASHAPNGANVIPSNASWNSFSICTREDGGSWEDSLKKVYRTNSDGTYFLDENGQKVTFVKGVDYATEGWINGSEGMKNNSSEVTFYSKATGWDGEYGQMTRNGPSVLVADNPWGMTLTMTGITVEFGRYYTIDFDLDGDLHETIYNAITHKTTFKPSDKHILLKAYDYNSNGEPSAGFEKVVQKVIERDPDTKEVKIIDDKEVSKDGYITVFNPKAWEDDGIDPGFVSHVSATFKIPESPDDWGGGKHKGSFTNVGIKFAIGANLVSYPEEGSMRGNFHISNMKMTAGKQYTVKYFDGKTQKATRYVNDEETANSVKLSKSRYSLAGYTDVATGKKFNFSTTLTKDMNLRAIWSKTPAPGKPSFKVKSKKKRRGTVTFDPIKNVRGYQVMYSYSSKFKKKSKFKTKTKNSSNTATYTIKSLKSGAVVYVKSRGYNLDSTGQKIYGPWSSRKVAYVR